MGKYYVNKHPQKNGDHEVHNTMCRYLPQAYDRQYLGDFSDGIMAVEAARRLFPRANGCYFCARESHSA